MLLTEKIGTLLFLTQTVGEDGKVVTVMALITIHFKHYNCIGQSFTVGNYFITMRLLTLKTYYRRRHRIGVPIRRALMSRHHSPLPLSLFLSVQYQRTAEAKAFKYQGFSTNTHPGVHDSLFLLPLLSSTSCF